MRDHTSESRWSTASFFYIDTSFIPPFCWWEAPVGHVIAVSAVIFDLPLDNNIIDPVNHLGEQISHETTLWSVFFHFLEAFPHQM